MENPALAVSARLSSLDDHELADRVRQAAAHGAGIGGRSATLDVDGTPVFVKRVPLTDLEMRPEHVRSTRNLFDLPTFYHYGLGSTGFGAWRELAVHLMTTGWVRAGDYDGFPLLLHWRVIPDSPPEGFADEFGGIDGAVAHWRGSPAVRARLEAIGRASYSLVLFLEHIPYTLGEWLTEEARFAWAERELARGCDFMSSRGLVHFDAHFRNVLTDGETLRFADFGLALSSQFELSPAETEFHSAHLRYDHDHTAGSLVREIRRIWKGDLPPGVAAIHDRHARTARVQEDFHRRLLAPANEVS
ncbi:protein kinase family protein [Herbidospora sp. NBRC 101105]|uniref:protein kinase family protein n=1 Tax=Herbidospora sp. NBRC 101105 TaxID=3032195 RepID=UPI002554C023|nr:protein kinase family protein [Herbidospora sp. NBRC 101105]